MDIAVEYLYPYVMWKLLTHNIVCAIIELSALSKADRQLAIMPFGELRAYKKIGVDRGNTDFLN